MNGYLQISFPISSPSNLRWTVQSSPDELLSANTIDVMVSQTRLIIQTNGRQLRKKELISILERVKTEIEDGKLLVPGNNIVEGDDV